VWHDPDFRECDVDAEATFTTTDPLPSDERVRPAELPAVEAMACVVHRGPPESIGGSCRMLLQWIDVNRRQIAGPERVHMIQRGGPGGADDIVELQVPIV
jgi:effector-binding domain-containing protein